MAFPSLTTFYLGLTLIVLGTGLLKGNVAVIVGQLYTADDPRRDAGFSIFYMGINLGAFIAPLVTSYLGQRINWHLGFTVAGIGMVLGLVQYVLGSKYLGRRGAASVAVGVARRGGATEAARADLGRRGSRRSRPVRCRDVHRRCCRSPRSRSPTPPACRSLVLTIAFFVWLFLAGEWTPVERKRLYAILALFLAATLVLVRVRAGRFDAQPVRRSRDAHVDPRLGVSERLFPVAAAAVHHHAGAGVRVDLDAARHPPAVEPGEVRARPALRRLRFRHPRRRRPARRERRARSRRGGSSSPICCTPSASCRSARSA